MWLPSPAQDNYSLWPRRPEELEQARQLISQQKWGEAVYLLQPFICDDGVTGAEARKMVGRVNVVRYLTRMHPHTSVYVVKRGDTLPRISAATKCPVDSLMLYNGLIAPSDLKIGQKLVYINMKLRVEIYPQLNELTVWDEDILVASYKIQSHKGIDVKANSAREDRIMSKESYLQGKKVPESSALSVSADKLLRLTGGCVISGKPSAGNQCICLEQKDINELAMLVREPNTVLWQNDLSAKK